MHVCICISGLLKLYFPKLYPAMIIVIGVYSNQACVISEKLYVFGVYCYILWKAYHLKIMRLVTQLIILQDDVWIMTYSSYSETWLISVSSKNVYNQILYLLRKEWTFTYLPIQPTNCGSFLFT